MPIRENTVGALVDAAPPATVGGLTLAGISLPDVVLILTAVYTVLRIGEWVYGKIIVPRSVSRREHGRK